jgi:polyisoprenoid-binding protein YceI
MPRVILTLFLSILSTNLIAADKYDIDTGHSHVGFAVKHMLVSTVKGNFKEFSGSIMYAPDDLSKSSVSITIKSASIDTDSERRDNHLRSDDFFNAEMYPEITFASKKIEKRGEAYVAIGEMTIRDVTKEIEIPFEVAGPVPGRRGSQLIGVDAAFEINRQDYGVKYSQTLDTGGLAVSNEVRIEVHVEAIHRLETAEKN